MEIFLDEGKISDMYCSCPYVENGRNCKHMAAVLYEWKEKGNTDDNLFIRVHTVQTYEKKKEAVRKLVEEADISAVRDFLTVVLVENEKLLVHFNRIAGGKMKEEDIERYVNQIDDIAKHYLGREHFINYYKAHGFISKLEDILAEDVRRMMDHEKYMSAFKLMNHIFVLIGDVDKDDSDGGTEMLAEQIFQLWIELLSCIEADEKQEKFN